MLLSDGVWPYSEVVKTVSEFFSMWGKPKIFFFNTCRKPGSKNFIEHIMQPHMPTRIESDILICCSVNDGSQYFTQDDRGSSYTQHLARLLMDFGNRLTLTEIVQLVHGWTKRSAIEGYGIQQPVMYCSLERLLVLTCEFSLLSLMSCSSVVTVNIHVQLYFCPNIEFVC